LQASLICTSCYSGSRTRPKTVHATTPNKMAKSRRQRHVPNPCFLKDFFALRLLSSLSVASRAIGIHSLSSAYHASCNSSPILLLQIITLSDWNVRRPRNHRILSSDANNISFGNGRTLTASPDCSGWVSHLFFQGACHLWQAGNTC
jgi:hypothetical protein